MHAHSGHKQPASREVTIWEGRSKSLSGLAAGGALARTTYRLTNHGLSVSSGWLTTNAYEVPLWAVRDLDLKQGMSQQLRGVGSIRVHVEHADYRGRATVELANVENPSLVRELIRQHARQERLRHDQ